MIRKSALARHGHPPFSSTFMKPALLLCLILVIPWSGFANIDDVFAWSSVQIPEKAAQEGQVAVYGEGTLLLAGGVDKAGRASPNLHVLTLGESGQFEWAETLLWDRPIGRCQSAGTLEAFYLTGLSGEPTATVYRLSFLEGELASRELPPLPTTIRVIGLDLVGPLLCVFGYDEETGENLLFTLPTGTPDADWVIRDAFPGPPLERAVVEANYGMLHIFGGAIAGEGGPTDLCYGWRERPIDGTEADGWIELKPLPAALSAGSTFITGEAHIGVWGSLMDPSGSIQNKLLLYHSVTDTWVEVEGNEPPVTPGERSVRFGEKFLFTGSGSANLPQLAFTPAVGTMNTTDYLTMAVYFTILAGIGFFFARRQRDSATFAVGGGNVMWWAAAISMFATAASAISFMAIPAQIYRTSLVWFLPIVVFIPFYFVQAYLLFPLLRKLNIISTYEYLQRRFHPALRMLASFQCIAFQTFGRISVVILLPALAISATTGFDVMYSVLLMGLVTTIYTTFGGYEAVVWTDVVQGFLMITGISLMIWCGMAGMDGGFQEFVAVGSQYNKFNLYLSGWDISMAMGGFLILRQLAEQFAQTGDQPIIQRVFSTPENKLKHFAATFAFFAILIMTLAQFVGLTIFGYFNANPELLSPFMDNDQVVPLFISQALPSGFSGLIIAALFAASMSTLSSSVNSVSTLIAEDFYIKFKRGVSDREKLLVMKGASLIVGLFGTGTALIMASMDIRSIFQLWYEIIALIGGGFVGMYFLGMFTTKANSGGVAVGAVFSVVCLLLVKNFTPIHWSLYQVIAIASCVLVGYLVSVLLPVRKRDLTGLTVFTAEENPGK